jgi:hypothetical protein
MRTQHGVFPRLTSFHSSCEQVARKAHEQSKRDDAQRRRDKMIAVMESDLLKRQTDANSRLDLQASEARVAEDLREVRPRITGLMTLCRKKQTIRQIKWLASYGARSEIWC